MSLGCTAIIKPATSTSSPSAASANGKSSAPEARDRFVEIFEQACQKYLFHIYGYVVVPKHVHILVSDPE